MVQGKFCDQQPETTAEPKSYLDKSETMPYDTMKASEQKVENLFQDAYGRLRSQEPELFNKFTSITGSQSDIKALFDHIPDLAQRTVHKVTLESSWKLKIGGREIRLL